MDLATVSDVYTRAFWVSAHFHIANKGFK